MYSETSLFLKSPNDRIIIFRYKVIVEYLSTNQPSGLWMEMHVLYCLQKWALAMNEWFGDVQLPVARQSNSELPPYRL